MEFDCASGGWTQQSAGFQTAAGLQSGAQRAVQNFHAWARQLLDQRFEEGEMGAAQDNGVYTTCQCGRQEMMQMLPDLWGVQATGLNVLQMCIRDSLYLLQL